MNNIFLQVLQFQLNSRKNFFFLSRIALKIDFGYNIAFLSSELLP